jgi:hypothetical protein
MDDPVEIVAKKIWHRGENFKARDFFDLATLYRSDRKEDLINEALAMPEKIDMIEKRIENLDFDVSKQIEPLPKGTNILGKEIFISSEFIKDVKSRLIKP